MIQITDNNYVSTLTDKKSVVRFTAPWCGPCRTLKPMFAELEDKWQDRVLFGEVNVDDNPVLTEQFGITSVPKTFYFDGTTGEIMIDTIIGGAKPKNVFDEAIANLVG